MKLRQRPVGFAVAALITIALAIAPFWRLLVGRGLIVPDDVGVADFFDAEFAVRVVLGRLLKGGHAPVWCPDLLGGMPLAGAADPLSVLLFWLLPPLWAVNALILVALGIAAAGGVRLGRQLGMHPWAAALTGFSFAWSGYLLCQLRHLGITLTVCWAPLAVAFLLDALGAASDRRRAARATLGFCATFGMQVAAGFPQSVYILGLAYGGLALALSFGLPRRDAAERLVWLLAACGLSVLLGMYQLLPMWEFGTLSSRSASRGIAWATRFNYAPRAALTFLLPYVFGDASHGDYTLGVFWEDYGYIGLPPLLLALYALVRTARERVTRALALVGAAAFLLVLGKHSPVFVLAFRVLPGLSTFRYPTRFLVVTELSLCALGGVGLTALHRDLTDRLSPAARDRLVALVFALTVANLWWVQARQNPIGDASAWLSPPVTARAIAREPGRFRVYTLDDKSPHVRAWARAHGWQDLRPLWANREFLAPNSNLHWGLTAAGGYSGLYTRNAAAVWGGHTDEIGLIQRTAPDLQLSPEFFRTLAMYNVRFLLMEGRIESPFLTEVPVRTEAPVTLYRLNVTLPRAFWVPQAEASASDRAAVDRLLTPDFNPTRDVIVHARALPALGPQRPDAQGTVRVARYDADAVDLVVTASAPGWMVLSDAYYPGWEATVDGRPARIYRANLNSRALPLPAGEHRVGMTFTAPAFWLGLRLSAVGLVLLAMGAWLARRIAPSPPPAGDP